MRRKAAPVHTDPVCFDGEGVIGAHRDPIAVSVPILKQITPLRFDFDGAPSCGARFYSLRGERVVGGIKFQADEVPAHLTRGD